MQEPAVLITEHPGRDVGSAGPGVDLALKLQVFEYLCQSQGHIHAAALAALGGRECPMRVVARDLNESIAKVEVFPPERQQLAPYAAQSGPHREILGNIVRRGPWPCRAAWRLLLGLGD